jgi:hypothetical protein
MILAIVLVVIVAAALWFGVGTAEAAEPIELPKPDPLIKRREDPLVVTVPTSRGPLTLVQPYDTTGLNELTKPVAPAVPLVNTTTLKPAFQGIQRL